MDKFLVEKSPFLKGVVEVEGAKNSALPILAAIILSNGETIISNIPFLTDINIMCELLKSLNIKIEKNIKEKTIIANTKDIFNGNISFDLVKKIRASFLLAGPMLAKFGKVSIQLPGGCPIGVRPIDLHLKGFKLLGAEINQKHGIIEIIAKKLKGAEIYLDFP